MIPSAIATPCSSPPRGSAGTSPAGRDPLPYWLSGGLNILLVVASAAGLFIPGLYRDTPNWIAQTRGTDLVTLVVAIPALAASLILAVRGSPRAQVIWLGVLGYVLYMYVIYAFDVAFNPLFLVYVAALSLSLWSLITVLLRTNRDDPQVRFAPNLPVRSIAGYLLVVAALFCLAWLKDIIPAAVGNSAPAGLHGLKLPTNPVHVLDLSVLLPLAALSGIWLWQRRSWSYLLAGVILTTLTIVGLSIISGTVFTYSQDPKTSLAVVPLLALVTLAGLWLLVGYLRNVRPGTVPGAPLTAEEPGSGARLGVKQGRHRSANHDADE
jgi:hypothetical protein